MKWSVIEEQKDDEVEPVQDDHNLLRRMQLEDSKNLTSYVDKL